MSLLSSVCVLTLIGLPGGSAQTCPVFIADPDRRDCHPWIPASQAACEDRGCLWCEAQETGFPWLVAYVSIV